MTPTRPTRPSDAKKPNTSRARGAALDESRRHGVQLSYEGVTAAYIRDITRRPRGAHAS